MLMSRRNKILGERNRKALRLPAGQRAGWGCVMFCFVGGGVGGVVVFGWVFGGERAEWRPRQPVAAILDNSDREKKN